MKILDMLFKLCYNTNPLSMGWNYIGPLAQPVEHHTFNVRALGSTPRRLKNKFIKRSA